MKQLLLCLLSAMMMYIWQPCRAQAHINMTETEIRTQHPTNKWELRYTKAGAKSLISDFTYGTFAYFFNSLDVCSFCIQVPFSIGKMNGQIEIYNNKYVILSPTKWRAYLNEGGIMNIELKYYPEDNVSVFIYTSN